MDFLQFNEVPATKKDITKKIVKKEVKKVVDKKEGVNSFISSLSGERTQYDFTKERKKIACTCERCKDTRVHSIVEVRVRNKLTNIISNVLKCVCRTCNFAYRVT